MKKLRLGLLIDNAEIPAWAYEMLGSVVKKDLGSFVFIIRKIRNPAAALAAENNFHYWSYNTFARIENSFFKPSPNAFELRNIQSLELGPQLRDVRFEETEKGDYLFPHDIEKIKADEPDVIIYLGKNILRGDILTIPKSGVWSYYHGDNLVNRGPLPAFREVMKNSRDTGSMLQILSEDIYNGQALQRSWSSTDRISVNRNRNKSYWSAAAFLPRKLEELYQTGSANFAKKINRENGTPRFYSNKLYHKPRNREAIGLIGGHLYKWLKSKLEKIFYVNQWILLYSFLAVNEFETALYRYKKMTPPRDRFWADPFVVFKDGTYFIFLEEGLFAENNGRAHLSVIEMDSQGRYGTPKIILKKPYHLSYPNVFEENGVYYMIPESMDNKTIEIYKAISFPYEWEFVMNLMENVKAVDTTIIHKDGQYWLFANMRQFAGASECDELYIFYADSLLTTAWIPHSQNPVVSDVKSARPAGSFFMYGDKLYRPSQDCSYRYGHSTIINEVIELNKDEYRETKVSSIEPDWDKNILGTHTLNADGGLTVIDAILRNRKF